MGHRVVDPERLEAEPDRPRTLRRPPEPAGPSPIAVDRSGDDDGR